MTKNETDERTMKSISGAQFYKCALQVNPFKYLVRHNVPLQYQSEAEYNDAIVATCKDTNVNAIAVTDHYRIRSSISLIECARAAGIVVFPGFEAVTKEGVHLLCLFETNKDPHEIERILGDCGIHEYSEVSPTGRYDVLEFLVESEQWDSVCIAAHVTQDGGLLQMQSGLARINAWTSSRLRACSLSASVEDAPENLRPILNNKNAEYKRKYPVAIVNAKDISNPQTFEDPGATTWIKMSDVSLSGLRLAFLDPDSRIRLNSEPEPQKHSEFVRLTWEGGFLDGTSIHFNPNLNVLVGGRGAGKSTTIESLRYVLNLEPVGKEARKSHSGMVSQVLGSGTKISLQLRSYSPAERTYLIKRTIPNPPVVRDFSGEILDIEPKDLCPRIEVFGQREISEISRSPEKLTSLLDRFKDRDMALEQRKAEIRRNLIDSGRFLADTRSKLQKIDESLATLPRLEETLQRYQDAGLDERLHEQNLLLKEEVLLNKIPESQSEFRQCLQTLSQRLPISRTFLSAESLNELPGKEILYESGSVLESLSSDLERISSLLEEALDRSDRALADIRSRWSERKRDVDEAYNKILRELRKSQIDGDEFMTLMRQVESLRPAKESLPQIKQEEEEHLKQRRLLLAKWEDVKAEEFRLLDRAARRVSRKLREHVKVEVTYAGDRTPLIEALKRDIGRRLSETITEINQSTDFSLPEFVDSCRSGVETLRGKYRIPISQAERLSRADPEVFMRMEELELPPTTIIHLNTAPVGELPVWQVLDALSSGQKATAVLLLLLLDSDAPLVVDQPEDDLDNRFITEGIVPKIREEKRQRQFVFSTHNANIPVLGDAELIMGLTPFGEAGDGRATIREKHIGSLDNTHVRELVEEILEGGKAAFEVRRMKYGF